MAGQLRRPSRCCTILLVNESKPTKVLRNNGPNNFCLTLHGHSWERRSKEAVYLHVHTDGTGALKIDTHRLMSAPHDVELLGH